MTKFLDKSFSTYAPGDSSYRDNWEATFGKRATAEAIPTCLNCPCPVGFHDSTGRCTTPKCGCEVLKNSNPGWRMSSLGDDVPRSASAQPDEHIFGGIMVSDYDRAIPIDRRDALRRLVEAVTLAFPLHASRPPELVQALDFAVRASASAPRAIVFRPPGPPCPRCNGDGAVLNEDGQRIVCPACRGVGREHKPASPYRDASNPQPECIACGEPAPHQEWRCPTHRVGATVPRPGSAQPPTDFGREAFRHGRALFAWLSCYRDCRDCDGKPEWREGEVEHEADCAQGEVVDAWKAFEAKNFSAAMAPEAAGPCASPAAEKAPEEAPEPMCDACGLDAAKYCEECAFSTTR